LIERIGLRFALLVLLVPLWTADTVQAQALLAQPQAAFIVVETSLPAVDYPAFSLAKNSDSFSPDSAENKELRDKGFGFPVSVRRVLDTHVVAYAATPRLLVPVPFGWRGFDDGTRTRLFTPAGNVGIVINAMPMEGFETWEETREQVWKHARQTAEERAKKDPRYSARLIKLPDGMFGMRETNIYEGDDDPFSSVTLFRQHPDDPRMAIRMNLFAPVGDFERHLGLAGRVMKDLLGAVIPTGLDVDYLKIPASGSPRGIR
jgi:hypothetical protein